MSEVQVSQKWKLHIGCHRGTLMSRDSETSEYDSLDACRKSVQEAEEFWSKMGYYVWFAYAFSPSGEKIALHKGTPYQ